MFLTPTHVCQPGHCRSDVAVGTVEPGTDWSIVPSPGRSRVVCDTEAAAAAAVSAQRPPQSNV